jgi:hypothetical protein
MIKFSELLVDMWGEAFSNKIKEGSNFTVSDIDVELKSMLFEIDFWTPEVVTTPNGFNIIAKESNPFFSITLSKISDGTYGIKFDDVTGGYEWEKSNVKKMKKALFLQTVTKTIIGKMIISGEITTLVFAPEASDGREADRLKLFTHLYSELQKAVTKGHLTFNKDDSEYSGAMSIKYNN